MSLFFSFSFYKMVVEKNNTLLRQLTFREYPDVPLLDLFLFLFFDFFVGGESSKETSYKTYEKILFATNLPRSQVYLWSIWQKQPTSVNQNTTLILNKWRVKHECVNKFSVVTFHSSFLDNSEAFYTSEKLYCVYFTNDCQWLCESSALIVDIMYHYNSRTAKYVLWSLKRFAPRIYKQFWFYGHHCEARNTRIHSVYVILV